MNLDTTVLLALALDAAFGEPGWIYARVPHPVVFFGRLVGLLDRTLNRETATRFARRLSGIAAVVLLVMLTAGPAWLLSWSLSATSWGWIAEAVLASTLIAQQSLYTHVAAVASALETEGLAGGRRAVSMIVGRNPESLDEHGVCRAAIESCAENFSDGIVAPVFWFAVLGFPGLVAYKAINTADSMIGHRTPRFEAFGWAAARLDDLVNLLPARSAGLFIILGTAAFLKGKRLRRAHAAWKIMLRDAGKHRSPNAGWQEAAMAGALGLALAGPRRYGDVVVEDAWMGEGGRREATSEDIRRALRILLGACVIQATLIAGLAVLG
ncbi:adenosylcobinamide-phosphate synthase [Skermanella aerolata]|uniref:Cobalamin biosynthesis protein CobD n=1 Tax=Skermanella aerolata TaxID=393310 RepID=A0A512DJD7_9PROT|nr:adenosylcobinamide-phosphate synthase CbiB [Skermanella aerolata]KJB97261.1 cobalamin biosynthesis protein CobD [Skermanella aerolata KACC 11604]GEO36587.1 cobalamin biosynthesis protein CobD [Skermanella aerolata]